MSVCKVHNVRFYKPKPKAIYCMSVNKSLQKLAVSRSDASIEIWNLEAIPFIERTFATSTENYSIEGLAWCKNTLFSVGLHGFLVEYDLKKLTFVNKTSVTGQTAYCLDVNHEGTQIAVGTEKGLINIFMYDQDGVTFEKFLDKQQGRIMCLKYDYSGNFIVSGSTDTVRVWNVNTGHAIHRMTTGRITKNKPTIIWCIDIMRDMTIVTGDARGKITFWDGNVGAQVESYQSHRADVLSLCIAEDEKTLYCSGIDSTTISYVKVNVKGEMHKWVKSIQKKFHDHDVRALTVHGENLYSGGIDGYLASSIFPKKAAKYPPILQSPCVKISAESRFILLRHQKFLELWSLGESSDEEIKDNKFLPLKRDSKKLLVLQRNVQGDVKKDVKEGIITSSISNNGKWIVYSTNTVLRLFTFNYDGEEKAQLVPCDNLPAECGVSVNSVFTPNNNQLILAQQSGNLQIINIKQDPIVVQTIETSSYIKDVISFLNCSPCGQFLLAADPQSCIAVWKYIDATWQFYCKLPKYRFSPTAINIQPVTMNVIIAYTDRTLVEFNLFKRKLTQFSKELGQSECDFLLKCSTIRNITFDPRNDNVIILHDDSNILIIDKEKKLSESLKKVAKHEERRAEIKTKKQSVHSIEKYKHLVHLDWISNDEMVAVEVNPLSLLEQLPPGFKYDTFGTK